MHCQALFNGDQRSHVLAVRNQDVLVLQFSMGEQGLPGQRVWILASPGNFSRSCDSFGGECC